MHNFIRPILLAGAALFVRSALAETPVDLSNLPDAELKKKLTPEQFFITREKGTEPPFHNAYWNNHTAGIYVDVISGKPLFSSKDKFDSGTGWPSFTRPIEDGAVALKDEGDHSEVRGARSNAHLGDLFDDGPAPTGKRFCIDSAALRFVPADQLQSSGYGEYIKLFGG